MLSGIHADGLVYHVDELDLHLVAFGELGQRVLEEEGNPVSQAELRRSRVEGSHRRFFSG